MPLACARRRWCGTRFSHCPTQRGRLWLLLADWFHTVLELSPAAVTILVSSLYFIAFLVYAGFYYIIGSRGDCNADFDTYADCFLFSVETMSACARMSLCSSSPEISLCLPRRRRRRRAALPVEVSPRMP